MGHGFISRIGMAVEGNVWGVFNVPRLRGQTKEKRHLR